MLADVAGFVACDYAADRVPIPGGLVRDTGLRPGQVHHFPVMIEPDRPVDRRVFPEQTAQ
jgi:hypothetical protein